MCHSYWIKLYVVIFWVPILYFTTSFMVLEREKKGKDKFEAVLFCWEGKKVFLERCQGANYIVPLWWDCYTTHNFACTSTMYMHSTPFLIYSLHILSLNVYCSESLWGFLSKMTYSDNLNCFDFLNYLPMCIYTGCLILKRAFWIGSEG